MTDNKKLYIFSIYLGLAIVAIVTFGQVRLNNFVSYDDPYTVVQNSHVNHGVTPQSIYWAFNNTFALNSTPLTWVSYMLDCQLFGLKSGYHHLMSLFFHIVTTLLLFWILKKSTNAMWPSAFVAALFAIHPLNVEPVAWISQRAYILGAFFWTLTTAAYISYVRCRNKFIYLMTILLFELGVMTNAVIITLPSVLLLMDYWPLRRFSPDSTTPANQTAKRIFLQLVKEKIPFFALALVSITTTFSIFKDSVPVRSFENLSLLTRLLNVLAAYISYIDSIIRPINMAVLYPYPGKDLPLWQPVIAFAALAAFTMLFLKSAKRKPYLIVGWIWFLLVMLPTICLVKVDVMSNADRYAYLPSIGIFIMIAWGTAELVEKNYLSKNVCAVLAGITLVTLAICSHTQVKYWKDTFTLYEHTLTVTKDNYFIHYNYGSALFAEGRLDDAIRQYEETVKIDPNYYESIYQLGQVYLQQGKLDRAAEYFEQVLHLVPRHPDAHYYLAIILTEKGYYEAAIDHLRKAMEYRIIWPAAFYSLARVYYLDGKPDYAIRYCATTLNFEPGFLPARITLAHTLAKKGRYKAAIRQYYIVLKAAPDQVCTLKTLALILATVDDTPLRDTSEALRLAKRASQLTGDDAKSLGTLAIVYSTLGQFDDAVQAAQKSIDLATTDNQTDLADEIRGDMRLYQTRQPYRLQPATFNSSLFDFRFPPLAGTEAKALD